jgi:hypothetical protein
MELPGAEAGALIADAAAESFLACDGKDGVWVQPSSPRLLRDVPDGVSH